jgi:hypothetical protein
MGTSSMRRKSKHEELRARAFGSEMDNEAEASKDMLCGGEGKGFDRRGLRRGGGGGG